MGEACRFNHIRIQAAPSFNQFPGILTQAFCKATADLCDLQGVRKTVVKKVPLTGRYHLGYPAEAAELR